MKPDRITSKCQTHFVCFWIFCEVMTCSSKLDNSVGPSENSGTCQQLSLLAKQALGHRKPQGQKEHMSLIQLMPSSCHQQISLSWSQARYQYQAQLEGERLILRKTQFLKDMNHGNAWNLGEHLGKQHTCLPLFSCSLWGTRFGQSGTQQMKPQCGPVQPHSCPYLSQELFEHLEQPYLPLLEYLSVHLLMVFTVWWGRGLGERYITYGLLLPSC